MSQYSPDNPEGNPWTFIDKTDYSDDPWINYSRHKLLNHQGSEAVYNVIRFKQKAVAIVAYEDGFIWLVGQYRYPLARYFWELPAGGCPKGEETIHTARRELREETGLTAKRWEKLLEMHPSNGVTDEYAVVFLATDLKHGQPSPDENEVLQTRRVTLDALLQNVEAGRITDGMTVAATYKMALLRERGKLD